MNSAPLKVVFFGTPEFAVPALKALAGSGENLVAVYSQPDRPAHRGQKMKAPPVKEAALKLGLEIRQPEKLRGASTLEDFKALKPDLAVVVAYGKILKRHYLEVPRLGFINVHGSLLPRYRGAAPIQQCLIDGAKETGITIMQLDEGMDRGDVFLKRALPIGDEDNAGTLHDKLALLGAEALIEALAGLKTGVLKSRPQEHDQATLTRPLTKEDGLIDFNVPAREVVNLIRGVTPWPGAHSYINGKVIKISLAKVEKRAHQETPGKILQADCRARKLVIACRSDAIAVEECQLAGRKCLCIADFLAGTVLRKGSILGKQ